MIRFLAALGRSSRRAAGVGGSLARLIWTLGIRTLRLPSLPLGLIGKITATQVRFSGLHAAPLVALVATLIGAVAIIQSFSLLSGLADDLIGSLLVAVVVRELGPLITAVILIGRSGTAMATELGSMRLNGEIEALEAYRIDPLVFVVLPRVFGAVFALFALMVVFDVLGIVGGFAVSILLTDISFAVLKARVLSALGNADLGLSTLKALAFGTAIAILCCHFGLRVGKSPTELPQAVTKAVVASLVAVFLIDSALAVAFYLL